MRWALLLCLAAVFLAVLQVGPGLIASWRRGERPRWWFCRRRWRRLILEHAPNLAQWERRIAADPFGADPFQKEQWQ